MALQDLKIRAALETAGVTRGVQEIARELARVQVLAGKSLAAAAVPANLATDARRAGEAMGHAVTAGIERSIRADQARVQAALKSISQLPTPVSTAGPVTLGPAVPMGPPQSAIRNWQDFAAAIRAEKEAAEAAAAANNQLAAATANVGRQTAFSAEEVARFEAQLQARRQASQQASAASAAQSAREQALAATAALESQLRLDQARIKDAQLRGFLTPAQAAQAGREAAQAYNQGVIAAIDRGSAARAFQGAAGREAFTTIAGSIKNVDTEARRAGIGIASLRGPLVTISTQALATNPAMGQFASILGSLAFGSGVMVGVLAGLAAISTALHLITRESREAKEALQDAQEVIDRLQRRREAEALGPAGTEIVARTALQAEADRIQNEINRLEAQRSLSSALPASAGAFGVAGLNQAAADENLRSLRRQLAERQKIIEQANQGIAEIEGRAAAERAKRLLEAETRLGDLLGAARVAEAVGVFSPSELPAGLQDALQKTTALRTQMQSLRDAIAAVQEIGGPVPAGAIEELQRLQSGVAAADRELQRTISKFRSAAEDLRKGTGISPVSVPRMEEAFGQAVAQDRERFARGLIDRQQFERAGREAALHFNAGLLDEIERLRASGQIEKALELTGKLNIDLQVEGGGRAEAIQAAQEATAAFNENIAAANEVFSAFGDLANAADLLGAKFSDALRGLQTFSEGVSRIRFGQELANQGQAGLGALAQLSGIAAIAVGAIQIVRAGEEASRQQAAEIQRFADESQRARVALDDFRRSLEEASKFDNQLAQLEDTTGAAIIAAFREQLASSSGFTPEGIDRLTRELQATLDAGGLKQVLEFWQTQGAVWTEIASKFRDAAERIEQLRAAEIGSRLENLDVRELVATGRAAEANALRLEIQQRQEYAEALKLGFNEEQLARLKYVQGLEASAAAVQDAATAMQGVPETFLFTLASIRAAGTRTYVPEASMAIARTADPASFSTPATSQAERGFHFSFGDVSVEVDAREDTSELSDKVTSALGEAVVSAMQQAGVNVTSQMVEEIRRKLKPSLTSAASSAGKAGQDLANIWPGN